jgi:hypothetical protein
MNKRSKKRNTNQLRKNKKIPRSLDPGRGTLTDRIISSGNFDIIQPSKTVWLDYIDATLVRNNAGANYLVFLMRANSPYDPDPLLSTGGISGFAEMSAFYSQYRVTHCQISWTVANKESFPVHIGFNLSSAPLAVTTVAKAIDCLENGYSVGPATISTSGGMDRVMLTKRVTLSHIWGNLIQYEADDNWAASVISNPSFLIYINFLAYASTPFVNGIDSDLRLRFRVKFYSRYALQG